MAFQFQIGQVQKWLLRRTTHPCVVVVLQPVLLDISAVSFGMVHSNNLTPFLKYLQPLQNRVLNQSHSIYTVRHKQASCQWDLSFQAHQGFALEVLHYTAWVADPMDLPKRLPEMPLEQHKQPKRCRQQWVKESLHRLHCLHRFHCFHCLHRLHGLHCLHLDPIFTYKMQMRDLGPKKRTWICHPRWRATGPQNCCQKFTLEKRMNAICPGFNKRSKPDKLYRRITRIKFEKKCAQPRTKHPRNGHSADARQNWEPTKNYWSCSLAAPKTAAMQAQMSTHFDCRKADKPRVGMPQIDATESLAASWAQITGACSPKQEDLT